MWWLEPPASTSKARTRGLFYIRHCSCMLPLTESINTVKEIDMLTHTPDPKNPQPGQPSDPNPNPANPDKR